MQELYISECTCRDEAETSHTFRYFMLTDRTYLDGSAHTDYGIMVQATGSEPVRIAHITTDRARIDQLLTLLQEHGVSPSHLQDVVDDWL